MPFGFHFVAALLPLDSVLLLLDSFGFRFVMEQVYQADFSAQLQILRKNQAHLLFG